MGGDESMDLGVVYLEHCLADTDFYDSLQGWDDSATRFVLADEPPPPGWVQYWIVLRGQRVQRSTAYLVRLAAEPEVECQALPADPVTRRVTVSQDGRWALAHDSARPNYLRDLENSSDWVPFLRNATGHFRGTVIGKDFVAVTDQGAANGRVVAIPLDGSAWRELVPAGDCVLFSVADMGTELVLAEYADGASRLRRIAPDGTVLGEIPLPDKGMVWQGPGHDEGMVTTAGNGCTFSFSSLTRSPATYHYVAGATAPLRVTAAGIGRRRGHANRRRQRHPIQAGVQGRAPRPATVDHRCLRRTQHRLATGIPVRAAGGVGAPRRCLRAGPSARRRRVRHRLVAGSPAAHQTDHLRRPLHRRHRSDQPGLDNVGTARRAAHSRGGNTAPPAVPCLRRRDASARPAALLQEPGNHGRYRGHRPRDPQDPSDAAVLRAYSPYHQVRDGTAYPAMLLDCGASNQSCPAWHGRKMTARLRQATSSQHPVLLRVRPAGHIPDTAPEDVLWREAEQLAFFAEELGLPLPTV